MALIRCLECGKEVSDKATACIHCGCPLNVNNSVPVANPTPVRSKGKMAWLVIPFVLLIVLMVWKLDILQLSDTENERSLGTQMTGSEDAQTIAREKVTALIERGAKGVGDGKFIEDSYKAYPEDVVIANLYFYHTAKESYERYELFGSKMYLTTAIDYASMIDPNYNGIYYEDVQALANKVLGEESREASYQVASQKEDTYYSLTNAQKKEICQYIQSRFDYYGKLDGTNGGKYTDVIWKETCEKYGLTASQVDIIWMNMYSY